MPSATYDRAIQSLYALGHELHHTPDAPRRKWELAHMRTLCAALGNPQQKFPAILIAGTNGKGSTAATLAAILQAAGYRTALYTSPHLVRVNERIRIDGVEISDDDFARIYFSVDDTAQNLVREGALPHPPSFFEVMTALAFTCFAEQGVQIAILEVGLGGRLDATNIVEPLLSVIADIALDHTEYLGNTITEIAREKAGILRENGILVTLPQHPQANQAIGEIAVALNVSGINAAEYMPARRMENGTENTDALFRNRYPLTVLGEEIAVDSPLAGPHQQRNIALAIAAAVTLAEKNKYAITAKNIADGIRNTRWPGRLEYLEQNNFEQDHIPTKTAPILLDVAHNPAGVWALRSVLAHLPDAQPHLRAKTLIFSCLRDKALTEMAQILFSLFSGPNDRILVPPIANPRAASVEEILAAADALGIHARSIENVHLAIQNALKTTPENGIIVATGSVYLVGAVRELITGELK